MSTGRTYFLTAITMVAFAANSILCRLALRSAHIDPGLFTLVRLACGAATLWVLVRLRAHPSSGNWTSGFFLFAYAAAFSLAYLSLTASTGALLLFGAVQATMIFVGWLRGERLNLWQTLGLALAVAGLVYLVLPGVTAPPLVGAVLMLAAGTAWGGYSLRARGSADPVATNAGNFARATGFAVLVLAAFAVRRGMHSDLRGLGLAIASGAIASGLGYSLWYTAMRGLNAIRAATVQLSVPVITAFAGVVLLGESITTRLTLASAAILGGIALVVLERRVTPAGVSAGGGLPR